jgi:dTMP kinase
LQLLVEYAQSPDNLLILDRYKYSGIAYGTADGLEAPWLRTIQSCIPDADLNIYIDISVDESKRRRPERRDYYETNYEKLQRVRDIYRAEFQYVSADDSDQCLIVDGERSQEEVTKEIVEAIWKRIGSPFSDS